MSILTTDLIAYAALNLPLDDVSLTGGAPDAQRRPVFAQLLANSTLVYSSSGPDTRVVQATGRDSTGAIVSEAVVLTGAVAVSGTQIFERLQIVSITGGASGAQTVTIGGGGVGQLGQIPPGELAFYMMFRNAGSQIIPVNRYEKLFWKNNNAGLTLTSAQVTLTADPSAKLTLGVAPANNDSATVATRLLPPAGVAFVGIGVAQGVPGGQLAAGSYIGVWMQQSLLANDAPLKSTFTTQLAGTSV